MSNMRPTIQGEPIAIVGMGCRLPGEVSSPSQLWQMLLDRRSGHCGIPESRFRAEAFYHPDADRPGSINSTSGYFIREDIHAFENAFFGIHNKEASSMDPQQRKLLEVAYEALESAGVTLEAISGSNTGVFVGNFTVDHMTMQYKDPEYFSRYSATGSDPTILANRITHCFDLRGPSSVIDTACSSSLYSLHAACSALDAHECDGALVASANLIQSPELQLIAVKAGILSPDGMCHTFDSTANGYGRAEAVSSLYLKRLSDAIRDGDPVRCVIRGTAVNGNGKTPGIMQPSIQGQSAVILKAYARAGLPTNETDYIEAHGTGTMVGDPIEVEAIANVLQHDDGRPIYIGGVKSSLGHSEGASGISSILKVALALEHGTIPATIGVRNINPSIRVEDWNVAIATETCSWPLTRLPRASINSFGFGGSNSHVVLEAADPHVRKAQLSGGTNLSVTSQRRVVFLPLAARTETSLARMSDNLTNYISQPRNNVDFRDLCHTLANRRSMLPTKGYFLANVESSKIALVANSFTSLEHPRTKKLPLAFIYTGQGAQWPRMGSQLIEEYPSYRRTIQQLDHHLASLGSIAPDWTLEAALLLPPGTSTINAAEISQPVCTAIQIALTDLLSDWNLHPELVLGHSSGEIAAAYATGALSQRNAIVTAYLRGLAVASSSRQGAMLAVGLDQKSAQKLIADTHCQETITIACINSPENVTLSGDKQAIDQLHDVLKAQAIFARKLDTNNKAYHSPHMVAIGPLYQRMLETHWQDVPEESQQLHGSTRPRMISTVTGTELNPSQYLDPCYWRKNLESTVQFESAVTKLFDIHRHMIVEIGPHKAMELPVKETASHSGITQDEYGYQATIVRHKDSTLTMLSLAGTLFLNGYDICLDRVNHMDKIDRPKVLHDLPSYPWTYETETLWTEPRSVREFRTRRYPRHDLLGSQIHHGNLSRTSWRNVLNPEEITWLQDHRLGPTMVFPAAAYMAMAVEAICQVSGSSVVACPGVEIREFSLLKALNFADESTRVEMFSELVPELVTTVSTSKSWWRFRVHSVTATQSTEHVSGLVRLLPNRSQPQRKLNFPTTEVQQQATRTWYAKFTSEGLNWGPQFAVMEDIYCDRDCQRHISSATTKNVASTPGAANQSRYIVHPINIDGMLQTAFVATTGGRVRDLRATVPVSIGYAYVMSPVNPTASAASHYIVDAESCSVGFGTVNIDAELRTSSGDLLVAMGDVRCIAYAGNVQSSLMEDRNPLVRVVWKPDIRAMGPGPSDGLTRYLEWFASTTQRSFSKSKRTRYVAGVLDLIAHWRPELRILELEAADTDFTAVALEVLSAGSPLRRMKSYVQARVTAEGDLVGRELCEAASDEKDLPLSDATFDVVLLPPNSGSPQAWPAALFRHMSTSSIVITDSSSTTPLAGTYTSFADGTQLSLLKPAEESMQPQDKISRTIMLVHFGSLTKLDNALIRVLNSIAASTITYIALTELGPKTIPPKCVVVATMEASSAVLRDLTESQMVQLQLLTDHAAKIVWVTNCNIMQGERPDFAVVQGLARALMLEQPSTVFSVFDVDDSHNDVGTTAKNISFVLLQLLNGDNPDFEYAQAGGVLYSLRLIPEDRLNADFRARVNGDPKEMVIKDARRCKLSLVHPGQLDTLHFVSDDFDSDLDSVEVKVQSVGINAKDLYVLAARVDTKNASCSCECSGIVTRVGPNVKNFKPGDRVVAMAPGHFATIERFPEWACYKLLEHEDFTSSSTIPLVYATALYAFCHRARLEESESVLIHSAAGGVGIAAIQLAQDIGAKIFATVGTQAKKDFLVQQFGLNPSHIFDSRNASFLPALMAATSGRGVDVVLNSLTGELLHESLVACANFGRFVEIGKRDILDHGRLDMAIFARNISFMAFDLHGLYSLEHRHQVLWQSLLAQSMQLFRSGRAEHVVQPKVFDASQITEAFRYFSSASRTGKVAVSFENADSVLRVVPERYGTRLDPQKAYFMVGCLGGLGRSISRWMASRGARNFVFLGRSGTDKPESQALVEDLVRNGAAVTVVRGDVSSYHDVKAAFSRASAPIGGVVQAAMGLDEALWTAMSCKSWHTAIDPKVKGTWNIHNALLEAQTDDVDFFVMTSSISGSVGTATESNYCSGNAFLDSFARYRTSLGLHAISIGLGMISEVGYLHEHPEIEKLMKRKGVHAIDEDELLHILDLALTNHSPSTTKSHYYDSLVTSHLLTGVEFVGLKDQRDRGFEGDNHVLADPRASLLAAAFTRSTAVRSDGVAHDQSLPERIKKALRDGSSASMLDATRQIVATKISNLILLPVEKLDLTQYLSQFGMDSMLAAEFRTYIFHALEVDVPFMTLLGDQTSVESLAQLIVGELEGRVSVEDQK